MTIAQVCERWTMPLPAPTPGQPWYLDWVLRQPSEAARHITAGHATFLAVKDALGSDAIRSVHEVFGGIGAYSCIIQGLFAPDTHTAAEWTPAAVQHLATLPGVQAELRDAFSDFGFGPRDLYVSDSPNFTAWQTQSGRGYRQLFDAMFRHDPKAVVFNDLAKARMHLHRARYEQLLGAGACASYETYLTALLVRLEALYGYKLLAGYVGRVSAIMALVPPGTPVGEPTLARNPTAPLGLELL